MSGVVWSTYTAARRHPVLAFLAAVMVLGVITHYWVATLIVVVLGVAGAVVIGRRRHRARRDAKLIAGADRSLAIARQHGLAALLDTDPEPQL
ncbi:hypothetical protein OG579_16920 [Williamsia herbipolensis]|uniref:Uncharacterized protein n=1 Tax=Williamsia herbipolensis TaxID=1603258 RepID=A0AAU4K004_9NOCA|nr:hypothetical protein [Williamsia herbipolensis]